MNIPSLNLDDVCEVKAFIDAYGTMRGRSLANKLGMAGRGSAKLASAFSSYAWNKLTACNLRLAGKIGEAVRYEEICDRIYSGIKPEFRPW